MLNMTSKCVLLKDVNTEEYLFDSMIERNFLMKKQKETHFLKKLSINNSNILRIFILKRHNNGSKILREKIL